MALYDYKGTRGLAPLSILGHPPRIKINSKHEIVKQEIRNKFSQQ